MDNLIKKFPDKKYLKSLVKSLQDKVLKYQSIDEQIVLYSSAAMNWISDLLTASNVNWEKKKINIENLYLTGTHPEWNKIIKDKCKGDPKLFKKEINTNSKSANLFKDINFEDIPILTRFDDGKYKIIDGMHRAIAAIRDNKKTITAYVAFITGDLNPVCEGHVVYDLIKAYQRSKKTKKNKESFINAIKLLNSAYSNVESLLNERFNYNWLPDKEIQDIFKKILAR